MKYNFRHYNFIIKNLSIKILYSNPEIMVKELVNLNSSEMGYLLEICYISLIFGKKTENKLDLLQVNILLLIYELKKINC